MTNRLTRFYIEYLGIHHHDLSVDDYPWNAYCCKAIFSCFVSRPWRNGSGVENCDVRNLALLQSLLRRYHEQRQPRSGLKHQLK